MSVYVCMHAALLLPLIDSKWKLLSICIHISSNLPSIQELQAKGWLRCTLPILEDGPYISQLNQREGGGCLNHHRYPSWTLAQDTGAKHPIGPHHAQLIRWVAARIVKVNGVYVILQATIILIIMLLLLYVTLTCKSFKTKVGCSTFGICSSLRCWQWFS